MPRRSPPVYGYKWFQPLRDLPQSATKEEHEVVYWRCYHRMKEAQAHNDGLTKGVVLGFSACLIIVGLVMGACK